MRALILCLLLLGVLPSLNAQFPMSQPVWDPVVGTTDHILALGKAGDQLLAVTANGFFASQDNGDSWFLRQNLRFQSSNLINLTLARDSVLLALVPNVGFGVAGYPYLRYDLLRSENGGDMLPTSFSYTPQGAMGTVLSVQSLYAADDSTLCLVSGLYQPTYGNHYSLYVSRNGGKGWYTEISFPGNSVSTCFASSGTTLWTHLADTVYHYDSGGLLGKHAVPGMSGGMAGGFWADDTLTMVSKYGPWQRSGDNGQSWEAGQLPFPTILDFWREKGLFYVRTPDALYRSVDFFSPDWEKIYEAGVSTGFFVNTIFRAGNTFFTQDNNSCRVLSRSLPADTGAPWEVLKSVGPDLASLSTLRLTNDTLVTSSVLCNYALGCGGVLRLIDPAPSGPSRFPFKDLWFIQLPDSHAILRSDDGGASWDTVLADAGFSGRFVGCGDRLFIYNEFSTQYSDDSGETWTPAPWGGKELWCDGPDTLLRRLFNGSFLYERSFNGGTDWSTLNFQPGGSAVWAYQGRLNTLSPGNIWTSEDWGENWTHTQIAGPGELYSTWQQDSIGIVTLRYHSYPVCINRTLVTLDGGASWQEWSNAPFRSGITCGAATLPYSAAAIQYLAKDGWLYARTDMSGLWRTRLDGSNMPGGANAGIFRDTICPGEAYPFFGDTLTASGLYQKVIVSAGGCDSIARLRLTVLPQVVTVDERTICAGDTAFFYGNAYTVSGLYEQIIPLSNGCDKIARLLLSVVPFDTAHLYDAFCPGAVFNFAGQLLDTPGDYIYTYPNSCSRVLLHLALKSDTTVYLDTTLTAGSVFLGQPLTTDTILQLVLTAANDCDSVVVWSVHVETSGVSSPTAQDSWMVAPNPSDGRLWVTLPKATKGAVQLRLLDLAGKTQRSWTWPDPPSAGLVLLLDGLPGGSYWLELNTSNGRSSKRLTLLRG